MPARRRVARDEIDQHMVWLRDALGDHTAQTRLLLGGILDVLDAIIEALPGPPRREDEP